MTTRIFVGDCREVLAGMPDGWYHVCVTSPPYWSLRDYGTEGQVWGGVDGCDHVWGEERIVEKTGGVSHSAKFHATTETGRTAAGELESQRFTASTGQFCTRCNAWHGNLGLEPTPSLFVEHLVEVMREVKRVLRDDGTLWLNLGDSYATGSKGTAEGMTPQDWIENDVVKKGGMTRAGCPPGLKPKDLCGIPWRVALALQADGWWLRSDIIWHKPNCMPESVTDRPTKAHEYVFLLTKRARYYFDADAVRERWSEAGIKRQSYGHNNAWGDQRFADPRDERKKGSRYEADAVEPAKGRNIRTVWTIPTRSFKGAHFATFPPALVTPCIKAGSSERGACPSCGSPWERVTKTMGYDRQRWAPGEDQYHTQAKGKHGKTSAFTTGDVAIKATTGWHSTCECNALPPVPCRILDPFGGAGTTALVARQLGRDCDLIELSPTYAEMAQQRLDATPVHTVETDAGVVGVQQIPMFSEVTLR